MNRFAVVVIIAGLIILGSFAFVFSGGLTQSTQNHSSTSTTTASTTTASGGASSSFYMAMNVVPTIRLVPLGGFANFTVVLYNGGDLTGNYSLSAVAPSSLSFEFDPSPVAVSGSGPHSRTMIVRSSGGMSPGTYAVTIKATGSSGVANQTFDFHVQRNLVLVTGYYPYDFSNITVKAGDSITWVSLDGVMSDEFDFAYNRVMLSNDLLKFNTTSGAIEQYASWTYTFTQPGVYGWYDLAIPTIHGVVIVTP